MSHVARTTAEIGVANEMLLRQAVDLVAKTLNEGYVSETYKNYSMQDERCDLALHCKELPRGLGIEFRKGSLTFVGDSWAHEDRYQKLQDQIVQTYQVLALQTSLEAMGYTFEETPTATEVETGEQIPTLRMVLAQA